MRRPAALAALSACLVLPARQAPDPLAWVPKRAGVVIVLNRPGQALARWDRLGERLRAKELALVRQAVTEDFGGLPLLDPEAPLVEFMVKPPKGPAKPKPGKDAAGQAEAKPKDLEFRVLAFKSKEDFAARFKPADFAKAQSDLTSVTVGGKPMLAAVRGRVAILGPKDQGGLLRALVADKARFPLPAGAEGAWAAGQDLAVFVAPSTMKGDPGPEAPKAKPGPAFLAPLERFSKAMREHPETEIASFVFGVRLGETGDLTGSLRLGVAPGGELAGMTKNLEQGGGPAFRGLPAAPFAVAFGMDFPASWGALMAQAVEEEAKRDPKANAAAVASMAALMRELRGFSLALRTPREGEPPASGLGLAFQVASAKAFLARAADLAARPDKDGTPGMKIGSASFRGLPVTTFTRVPPPPKQPAEGEQPSRVPPPEMLFGTKDVRTAMLQADDHTVIAGFGEADATFQAGLDSLARGGLGQLARVQTTRALLASSQGGLGQGVLYLSLPELIQMVGAFLPLPVSEEDLKAQIPPLGLALRLGSDRLELNLAVPADSLGLIGKLAGAAAQMGKKAKPEEM
ncbi:MAG: hypothetical protein U0P81_12645 [Holophagaceae bacterium]